MTWAWLLRVERQCQAFIAVTIFVVAMQFLFYMLEIKLECNTDPVWSSPPDHWYWSLTSWGPAGIIHQCFPSYLATGAQVIGYFLVAYTLYAPINFILMARHLFRVEGSSLSSWLVRSTFAANALALMMISLWWSSPNYPR